MSRSKASRGRGASDAASTAQALPFMPFEFPHPFRFGVPVKGPPAKSLLELRLIALSAAIRAKPEWHTKMQDAAIVSRWRAEAAEQKVPADGFEFVLRELQFISYRKQGPLELGPVDGTWLADGIVSADLKAALRAQVGVLEAVPEPLKDWHPGSNQQVLDLVHPSLFPLIYDVTLANQPSALPLPWPDCVGGGTELVRRPAAPVVGAKRRAVLEGISTKYQWLPTDFSISSEGKVTIDNYINNLHPDDHKALYGSIASIFERFVPLFNNVLTDMLHSSHRTCGNRLEISAGGVRVPSDGPYPPLRFPGKTVNLSGHTVQVIVKLANIVLTPERPSYPGGAWHVEGMQEEHIIATGIYYYHSENITTSRLTFRQSVSLEFPRDFSNEAAVRRFAEAYFGLCEGDPMVQELGSLKAKEDRCIAFPNLFQHRVAPFGLQDPTRPGLRKILVFFLVDPNHKGHSTSTVPPQRRDWIERELLKLDTLPPDLMKIVCGYAGLGLTWDEAVAHREALMHERKYYRKTVDDQLFAGADKLEMPDIDYRERSFSLCEH